MNARWRGDQGPPGHALRNTLSYWKQGAIGTCSSSKLAAATPHQKSQVDRVITTAGIGEPAAVAIPPYLKSYVSGAWGAHAWQQRWALERSGAQCVVCSWGARPRTQSRWGWLTRPCIPQRVGTWGVEPGRLIKKPVRRSFGGHGGPMRSAQMRP